MEPYKYHVAKFWSFSCSCPGGRIFFFFFFFYYIVTLTVLNGKLTKNVRVGTHYIFGTKGVGNLATNSTKFIKISRQGGIPAPWVCLCMYIPLHVVFIYVKYEYHVPTVKIPATYILKKKKFLLCLKTFLLLEMAVIYNKKRDEWYSF